MRCLAVRHSYIDQSIWALPGGGYSPLRETPEVAGRREVDEELGIKIADPLFALVTVESTLEGKQDSITILCGTAASEDLTLSPELAEARWTRRDLADLPPDASTSRWLRMAVAYD